MGQAIQKTIGGLKTFTIEGAAGGPCVMLMHGYGADSADLVPLADMMNLSSQVTWVFPEAPQQVIIAPGFHGRAWYQIDMSRLEKAMVQGQTVDLSSTNPPGIDSARKHITNLYDALLRQHSKVIVGGFSQGAMLATELAMTHNRKPDGLVIMSGSLICKERWASLVKSCEGMTFIQTHGKNDAILGYEYAEHLFALLDAGGLHGDFFGFSGGHEIPIKAIEKIAGYLRAVVR